MAAGILEILNSRQSHPVVKARSVRVQETPQGSPIVSAYYTSTGAGGVILEREWWQLVEAYKSYVYTCIDKIAKSVAMIPLGLFIYRSKQTGKVIRDIQWKSLYRKQKTDGDREYFLKNQNLIKEEIFDHPFIRLMSRPNDLMVRMVLWYETMIRVELGGLCGWLKIRDRLGVTRQIYPLPLTKYAKIRAKARSDMTLEFWEYMDGDIYKEFIPQDVFMIRYPHPASPFQGMSPLMAQIYPYDIDLFLMQQQAALFRHQAVPGMHLTTEQRLSPSQVKELRDQINEQFAGAIKAGETLITHSGLKADKLSQTGQEAMIDIVAKFARDKLITSFDLSPGKIGLVDDVNRASMQGLDRTFIRECLTPKCLLIEESIETFLLPEYDEGLTCDFELPSVEDQEFELKAMETRLKNFVTVVDDERNRLGMGPATTYDGTRPWMPMTMIQAGAEPAPQPGDGNGGGKTWPGANLHKALNLEYWTAARKDIHWKVFAKKSEKLEGLFLRPMRQYFQAQGEEVVKRLNREGNKILGQYAGWSRQKVEQHLSKNKANIRAINIDKKKEAAALVERFTPVLQTIMKEHGDERVRDLLHTVKGDGDDREAKQIEFEFNVNDPAVEKYLGSRMRTFSRSVSGTTFDDIEAILREGYAAGQPVATIAGTLREKFDSYDKYRAPLIARTEVLPAMNRSELEAVSQMGLEEDLIKHWLSARDNACRETHTIADERYSSDGIPMDEEFEVGADTMLHPGGGSLAEENIGCRCSMFFSQVDR